MYIADKFVVIEISKTGTTHINRILGETVKGETIGKHNSAPGELIGSNKTFVASIRDPFDWYVSLWSFGCKVKERDAVYRRSTAYRPFALNGYGFNKILDSQRKPT